MQTFAKDPDALLDYSIDWSLWLDGDTIQTSSWSVPPPLVLSNQSHTDTMATVWVSGGTVGARYVITNHIVTAAGREDERSLIIAIVDR